MKLHKILSTTICLFTLAIWLNAAPAEPKDSKAVLQSYEAVRVALAKDDLAAAQKASVDLSKKAQEIKNDVLAQNATDLSKSDKIELAREHFKVISTEAIKLVDAKSGLYIMTCPMANADWIQTKKEVENPYYGKSMLNCGMIKGK
jgi:hypothetical protein